MTTLVHYHGSLDEFHGPAWLVGRCECPECDNRERYRLQPLHPVIMTPLGCELECVRPKSYTVLN